MSAEAVVRALASAAVALAVSAPTAAHAAPTSADYWRDGACHAGDRTYTWQVGFFGLRTDPYGVVRIVVAGAAISLLNDDGTRLLPDRKIEWWVHTYQPGPNHVSPVQVRRTSEIGDVETNPYNPVDGDDDRLVLTVAEVGHLFCTVTVRPKL